MNYIAMYLKLWLCLRCILHEHSSSMRVVPGGQRHSKPPMVLLHSRPSIQGDCVSKHSLLSVIDNSVNNGSKQK